MSNVLITGGSRGIGLAVARAFTLKGDNVLATATSSDGLAQLPPEVHGAMLDLSLPDAFSGVRAVMREFDFVPDTVVVNAGIMRDAEHFLDQTKTEWDAVIGINLSGAFATAVETIPLLDKLRSNQIVFVSGGLGNVASGMPSGGYPAYRASKAGLSALAMSIAHDPQLSHVMAYGYDPGWVRTDLGGPDAPRAAGDVADELVSLVSNARRDTHNGRLFKDGGVIAW